MPCGADAEFSIQEYSHIPPFVSILKATCRPRGLSAGQHNKRDNIPSAHLAKREPGKKNWAKKLFGKKESEDEKLDRIQTNYARERNNKYQREERERPSEDTSSHVNPYPQYSEDTSSHVNPYPRYSEDTSNYVNPYPRYSGTPTRTPPSTSPRQTYYDTERDTRTYSTYQNSPRHYSQLNEEVAYGSNADANANYGSNYGSSGGYTTDCAEPSGSSNYGYGNQASSSSQPHDPSWDKDWVEDPNDYKWSDNKGKGASSTWWMVTDDGDAFMATNIRVFRNLRGEKLKKAKPVLFPDGSAWRVNDLKPNERIRSCVDVWQQKGHRVGLVLTTKLLLPLMSTWSEKGKHA